jgi:hypothetical protein
VFAFLTGNSFEIYKMFLTQFKFIANEHDLTLKPTKIACDFEKGTIKAFRLYFPGVKIFGCHFHFTSAVYKNIGEYGLKKFYESETKVKEFYCLIRMLMAFPFLILEDIDDCWEEMQENKPDFNARK